MKKFTLLVLILSFSISACGIIFTPPPINLTPIVPSPSITPNIIPSTPTITGIPGSSTPTCTETSLPSTPISPTPSETILPATATFTETVIPPTFTETTIPPTSTETALPPTATHAPVRGLTIEQLRNATITLMGMDQVQRTFTLQNGTYSSSSDSAQPGYIKATLLDIHAIGDLNRDGVGDATIAVAAEYGGSGTFVHIIAFLNESNQPLQVASTLLDDRPILNEMLIQDGKVYVNAVVHGPGDPACCPSQLTSRYYMLIGSRLVLARLTSRAASGIDRTIQIDAPASGSEISGPFTIKGSINTSPLENMLVYSLYSPNSEDPLTQGGFTIMSDGAGGPGTFELPLDFTGKGLSGPIIIEISDVSPADGSALALGSITLNFK